MRAAILGIALLALPVGARAEDSNPAWMFARRYIAESEALHFCLSRYDSAVREDTYMPAATKDKVATCVFLKTQDNARILMQAEEQVSKASQQ
jgi:hypothetical protein